MIVSACAPHCCCVYGVKGCGSERQKSKDTHTHTHTWQQAPPFEAANQLALAVKIKAGRVARLPEGYSDELNSAIRSMLQLESVKRPR